jgi:CRISPR/Cas system-associated exonuclease Cas4 (RecB family)
MIRELLQTAIIEGEPQRWPTFDGLELDRSEFLTSSEVANCLRQSYFAKYPEAYPAKLSWTNGFAERGHAIEAWFVGRFQALRKLGYKLEYMGKDQRSFYHAEMGISGTPDGLLTTPDGKKIMLEIKSIDPRFNKNNLPKKNHLYQVQQNMFLMQHCLGIKLDGAILFYIDASNVFDINEFPVTYNEGLVNISIERADTLWNAKEPEDLEAEGVYNGDCERCAYTQHCSQAVNMQKMLEGAGAVATPFFGEAGDDGETLNLNAEQVAQVDQYIEAWEGVHEYEKQKEEVAGDVKRLIVEEFNGRIQRNGYQLVATMTEGRETVDRKTMEAEGLTVLTKIGAPFVVMKVSSPKEEA